MREEQFVIVYNVYDGDIRPIHLGHHGMNGKTTIS